MATPVNITAPTTPKKVRIIYDNSQIGTTETPISGERCSSTCC